MLFKDACAQIRDALPTVVSTLQEELKNDIMLEGNDPDTIRIQFNYLNNLITRITNECI